ncbi:MAG: YdhR family protein [Planctomycetota bacterium]
MIIQVITFETTLSEEQVLATARERADRFRALPGLVQKYYVRLDRPNRFGGVYLWDSRESMDAYRQSDLAATIAEAYGVVGRPEIQILETLFDLRED